jgi:hypothetical protein
MIFSVCVEDENIIKKVAYGNKIAINFSIISETVCFEE